VWARERYDWSDPKTVRWTVLESNFCKPGGFVQVTVEPGDGGGSAVHLVWSREALSARWAPLMGLMVLTKGALIKASLKKGLGRVAESRDRGPGPEQP
jgi:hypothetical protein